MTIKTKTNLWLWLLTGRASDFLEPALNSGLQYPTARPSADVTAARTLLRLDVTTTDAFVLGALASAYASVPCLRGLPEESQVIFCPSVLSLPAMSYTGATALLPPDGVSWPHVSNTQRSGLDLAAQFTFTKAGSRVLVTSDTGLSEYGTYSYANGRLDIPLALDLGIRAAFARDTWVDGGAVVVTSPPSRYPFAAMATTIRDSSSALNLMATAGTMTAFASSIDPVRKVGALASAIMLKIFKDTVASLDSSVDDSVVVYDSPAAADAIADYQLMINWAPIFYGTDPVTYQP